MGPVGGGPSGILVGGLAEEGEICRVGQKGSKEHERDLFKGHRESGGQATGSGAGKVTRVQGGGPLQSHQSPRAGEATGRVSV